MHTDDDFRMLMLCERGNTWRYFYLDIHYSDRFLVSNSPIPHIAACGEYACAECPVVYPHDVTIERAEMVKQAASVGCKVMLN